MSKHIITVRQTLVEQFYLVVDADDYIHAKNIVNKSLDCDNENPPHDFDDVEKFPRDFVDFKRKWVNIENVEDVVRNDRHTELKRKVWNA